MMATEPRRAIALATAPLRGPGLERLRAEVDVVLDPWIDHRPLRLLDAEALAARVEAEAATILLCEADEVRGPVLDLPLVAIGSARGDPTNVDVAGATRVGIPVLHAPGRNADGVAELAVGLLFAVGRHLIAADHDVRSGEVYRGGTIPYQRFRAWQLAGRTVGIVGLGAVGRAAAWRFAGLGMRVISADPFAPDATHDLAGLLAEADVVSMHAAVTPDTAGMIDGAAIEAMRDGAIYLNTARAGLHDIDALAAALASGKLAGAGIDHFAGEQLDPNHPLASLDNVVLAPHIGGATFDTEVNHTTSLVDGVLALLRGERPSNCVNPEVLP